MKDSSTKRFHCPTEIWWRSTLQLFFTKWVTTRTLNTTLGVSGVGAVRFEMFKGQFTFDSGLRLQESPIVERESTSNIFILPNETGHLSIRLRFYTIKNTNCPWPPISEIMVSKYWISWEIGSFVYLCALMSIMRCHPTLLLLSL